MKFLINSKYLAAKIAQAIGNESTSWHADERDIVFTGGYEPVEMQVERIKENCQHNNEDFRPAYWRNVLKYLKCLPEQPLTVDMQYNSVEIYGVAVFKTIDTE